MLDILTKLMRKNVKKHPTNWREAFNQQGSGIKMSDVNPNNLSTTELAKERALKVGVEWYQWKTAEDQRVRASHQIMQNVLIRWDDPPSPEELLTGNPGSKYHAGEGDCRCYPSSLVTLNHVVWPAKVHINGKIIEMKKSEFMKIWNT